MHGGWGTTSLLAVAEVVYISSENAMPFSPPALPPRPLTKPPQAGRRPGVRWSRVVRSSRPLLPRPLLKLPSGWAIVCEALGRRRSTHRLSPSVDSFLLSSVVPLSPPSVTFWSELSTPFSIVCRAPVLLYSVAFLPPSHFALELSTSGLRCLRYSIKFYLFIPSRVGASRRVGATPIHVCGRGEYPVGRLQEPGLPSGRP